MKSVMERFHAFPTPKIEEQLVLRSGSYRDYQMLAEHHYRAARPATLMRVLVLEHAKPGVISRFVNQRSESQVVGVLVESLPSLSCHLRDEATGRRYANLMSMKQRARALNAEVRCISRVIVAPQWRGLGLAVRLVRHALEAATTPVTEAIAAMGNVHPFFERAGMLPYRAARSECDARLIAALRSVALSELDLAMAHRFVERVEAMEVSQRRWIWREMERWHRRTMMRKATDSREMVDGARRWLLCDAVYYLKVRE